MGGMCELLQSPHSSNAAFLLKTLACNARANSPTLLLQMQCADPIAAALTQHSINLNVCMERSHQAPPGSAESQRHTVDFGEHFATMLALLATLRHAARDGLGAWPDSLQRAHLSALIKVCVCKSKRSGFSGGQVVAELTSVP